MCVCVCVYVCVADEGEASRAQGSEANVFFSNYACFFCLPDESSGGVALYKIQ